MTERPSFCFARTLFKALYSLRASAHLYRREKNSQKKKSERLYDLHKISQQPSDHSKFLMFGAEGQGPLDDLMKLEFSQKDACIHGTLPTNFGVSQSLGASRLGDGHYIKDLYCSPRRKSSSFLITKCDKDCC